MIKLQFNTSEKITLNFTQNLLRVPLNLMGGVRLEMLVENPVRFIECDKFIYCGEHECGEYVSLVERI